MSKDKQTTNVFHCASCTEMHEDLEIIRLNRRTEEGHTHYAMCPTTGQPIMIKTDEVNPIDRVAWEVERQRKKYSDQHDSSHSPEMWLYIITERLHRIQAYQLHSRSMANPKRGELYEHAGLIFKEVAAMATCAMDQMSKKAQR